MLRNVESRVLICAPRGRDASLIAETLCRESIPSQAVPSIEILCGEIRVGVGAIIVTEEALTSAGLAEMRLVLADQDPWSDLPIIILTSGGDEGTDRTWAIIKKLEQGTNMSLLERPLRSFTLVSAVDVALRARRRQYLVRTMTMELEKRVAERTVELERLSDEAAGFSYTISHDLRSPLRAIVATSKILIEDYSHLLPASAIAELNRQSEAANSLAQLIDDLLHLSRLSREQMKSEKVDLSRLAEQVAHQLADDTRHHQCKFDIQPNVEAYADPTLLRFAMLNMMQNSCKFSPNGGTVRIGQSSDGTYFVQDHGIGFDQKYESKIFLPFERLVTSQEFQGTGIGLANVKRIIERHGGRVWAESEGPGKGACFRFTLPCPKTAICSAPANSAPTEVRHA
jgi:signal transduction histidine kinase